jgi:hypothetical protein
MNRKKPKPRLCAKCGGGEKLARCESGWICDSCAAANRIGRDETTTIIKTARIVSLGQPPIVERDDVTVHLAEIAIPPKPQKVAKPMEPAIAARDAAAHRVELLTYLGNECAALALDLELSMKPANAVERMSLDLMAVAYKAALEYSSKAFLAEDPADQTRLMNSAARMMENFRQATAGFQRLRTGGNQQIVVQHVTVADGGQAAIGNIRTGGAP